MNQDSYRIVLEGLEEIRERIKTDLEINLQKYQSLQQESKSVESAILTIKARFGNNFQPDKNQDLQEANKSSVTSNQQRQGNITLGDACEIILKRAGKPLHADVLVDALREFNRFTNKHNLTGTLPRESKGRFVNLGGNMFDLRNRQNQPYEAQEQNAVTAEFSGMSNRRILANLGFSLNGETTNLLSEFEGEFDQPIITNRLKEKFPRVAPYIQRASVSTTLQSLVKKGLIKETYAGFGSEPKRYRKIAVGEFSKLTEGNENGVAVSAATPLFPSNKEGDN